MGRLFVETITEWVRNMLTINCVGKAVCISELNDRRLLIFYFAKKRHFNKTHFTKCCIRFSPRLSMGGKPLVESLLG